MTAAPRANPYIGPRSFKRGEALFGRRRELAELQHLLIAERVVLLYSPSGAGKSSLIHAALIPALERRRFRVLPVIRVSTEPPAASAEDRGLRTELSGTIDNAVLSPQPSVLNRYILSTLLSLEEDRPKEDQVPLAELLGLTLADYLARRDATGERAEDLVLIFDQFEECLTVEPTDTAGKQAFFEQIGAALEDRHIWALFAMREDYVAMLDPFLRPIPNRFKDTFRLDLLGEAAARQAMQEPARQAGVEFPDAVAQRLADDLRRVQVQRLDGQRVTQFGPYIEPVQLQVVCLRLWEGLLPDATAIDEADLAAVGDVDTALAAYYADRVAAAARETGVSERTIREWCDQQLITEAGVRGQVLHEAGSSAGLNNRAVRQLVDAHLVRGEQRRGATWYELAHDRLIAPVRADNATWREDHLSMLQRQAALWERAGRTDGLVLRGPALDEAECWAAEHADELSASEQAFLADCRENRKRRQRERQQARRIRNLAIGAGLFAIAAVALAALAFVLFGRANQARIEAERQAQIARIRQLLAGARETHDQFPQRALLLALEAISETQRLDSHLPDAEQTLRDELATAGGRALTGHADTVGKIAFSPSGNILATASNDGTVRLWDVQGQGRQPIVLRGHKGQIVALAFSPDGRTLATGSFDAMARLWDVTRPDAPPVELRGDGAPVLTLAFSPDGRTLATGSRGGTVWLWDATRPNAPSMELRGHEQAVRALAFSPDGHHLATGGDDSTVRLWDVTRPNAPSMELRGHQGEIVALAFSPDGRSLATGGDDATARLWDVMRPNAPPVELPGHTQTIVALAFSPDGRSLATGSTDATVRLWDVRRPDTPPVELRGDGASILTLAFSPDGRALATGSFDGIARLWDISRPNPPSVELRGHEQAIAALAFSPDGRYLATGSVDTTARLWDVRQLAIAPIILRGNADQVTTIAFSPDGRALATGGFNGSLLLWDMAQPDVPAVKMPGHAAAVRALAFSPDGRSLATGGDDSMVRLWDVSQPNAPPVELRGHMAPVSSLVFSPDGRTLATSSFDGIVRLWDVSRPNPPSVELRGQEQAVRALAFSPDGRYLVTGSDDSIVRLWDVLRPGTSPVELRGHTAAISSLAFSPDGRTLATGSYDAMARLWDVARPNAPSVELRGHEQAIVVLEFSPDGRTLATGSTDATARLWDLAQPTARPIVLRGHERAVRALAFSPDGRTLATGSDDTMARLWDLAQPTAQPIVLRGHEKAVGALAFSPDGRTLATGSDDSTARLWSARQSELVELACATVGRNLSWEEWQQFLGDMPYYKICPDFPAHPSLIDAAASLAKTGDITGALKLEHQALTVSPAGAIPAASWDKLCRAGSWTGHAADVLDACQQAVAQAPERGTYRDSRGLARALTGDTKGAIEDFQAYVGWATQLRVPEEIVERRVAWIAALQAGHNPFDATTFEALRNESE